MTTNAERTHLDAVARLGCVVCWLGAIEGTPAACHHIRSGTGVARRESHWRVLPLCPPHHQYGDGSARFNGEIGYHVSPEQFEARYGTQEQLLAIVVERLGIKWDARFGPAPSKVVARRR